MKTHFLRTLVLVLLFLGACGDEVEPVDQAQQEAGEIPSYIIASVTIHNAEEFEKYLAGFMEIFSNFNGRVLVATDNMEVLEGEWPRTRTVILEFPSRDHAKRWYTSPEYQDLAQHRFRAANSNIVLVGGLAQP